MDFSQPVRARGSGTALALSRSGNLEGRHALLKLVRSSEEVLLPDGEWVVGRTEDASILIDDPSVSRRHAALRVRQGRLEVLDLGSQNGTFLNGARVRGDGRRARAGDTLAFGSVACELQRWPVPNPHALVGAPRGAPTQPLSTEAATGLARGGLPATGPVRSGRGAPSSLGARMVLALRDSSWAEQIRQAGELHRDLAVEIAGDVVTLEATARRAGAAALVLDLDLAGLQSKEIVRAWRDGASAGAPRPVLLTGTGAGASRTRALGAQAWLPTRKASINVVALVRFHLETEAVAGPAAAAAGPAKRTGAQ